MRILAAARFVAGIAAVASSITCGAKTPTQPPAPVYELKTQTFTAP